MESIVDNNVIDVGDTVYLIFEKTLQLSRKEKVNYNTHDSLRVLSFFDHVSGDDEDPIVTPYCKVEDANGNVFDEELVFLSRKPNDKDKRVTYFKGVAWRVGIFIAVVVGFIALICSRI